MSFSTHTVLAEENATADDRAVAGALMQRPPFRLSDIWRAPLHDFPIRDEILFQYLPLSPTMDVLEIGPGSGHTSFRLARHVRHLTLIDVAAENTKQLQESLRKVPNVTLMNADVCAPGLAESLGVRFDAIFGLEVFEYLADPGESLRNLASLLRRGGVLLLEFPNYPPPKSPGIAHFKTREELDDMLQAAGFQNWEVCALRLRPHARVLLNYFHEQPLRIVRYLRGRNHQRRAMTYQQTWAFQQRKKLETPKYALHAVWALLSLAIRVGGECFERISIGQQILNYDLLVLARR
jgi:cyclopropane fatty-acyl-phospholipid synthase-like methyltransferase